MLREESSLLFSASQRPALTRSETRNEMPPVTEDSHLPTPSWLDKCFLETALRCGEKDPRLRLLKSQVRPATNKGDNYASDMFRATAEFKRRDGDVVQRSLIIKSIPSGEKMGELIRKSSAFQREIEMFSRTLPQMLQLLDTAAPGKYKSFGADVLYTQEEPAPPTLVLEDLLPKGYKLATRQQGLDLDHSRLTIKTLATFHAASKVLYEKNPKTMTKYGVCIFVEEPVQLFIKNFVGTAAKALGDKVKDWPGFGQVYTDKLHDMAENIVERMISSVESDDSTFNVLNHGDLWVNNMMFNYCETTGKVKDVLFVDYQLAYFASPGIDLNYFLHTSPTEEVRIYHTEELLQTYLETFCETLDLLGYCGRRITFQELKKECDKYMFYALFAAISVLPIVVSEPSDGFDIEKALGPECSTDKENGKIFAGKTYIRAMKRMLPIFVQKGVL